jgi:hypothetical protein
MTDGDDGVRAAAEVAVREAVLVSVALVAKNQQQVDIPAAVLLEGAEVDLVSEVLARIVSALLTVVLPEDGGRQLLIRIGRQAVEGEPR